MKILTLFLIILMTSVDADCQYKSFKVLDNGDTLNRIDNNNQKQGKWKIHVNALRVEPAYDEEGIFVDDKKEGFWRKYDMYGMLIAVENYRWGQKNGLQQYLQDGQLVRDEMWRAVDPAKKFDTIDVPDINDPYKYEQKILKVEGYSQEHGTWKYYDPATGRIIKTETYFLGKLMPPKPQEVTITDTIPKPKVKPKAVLDFEKGGKGKKIKVRDGATGY